VPTRYPVILHHFDQSPFSEKIRFIPGVQAAHVEVSMHFRIMPRPMPMTSDRRSGGLSMSCSYPSGQARHAHETNLSASTARWPRWSRAKSHANTNTSRKTGDGVRAGLLDDHFA
jgi:hypothetical protein